MISKFYLLRTKSREQQKNGNKKECLPLGRRHCHFCKRRKIWWRFLPMNFLLWILQLKMKRADMKPTLAEAFIYSCKTKKWNKESVVLGIPGAENRNKRSQATLSLVPLTFECKQKHSPDFTERQALRGFAILVFKCFRLHWHYFIAGFNQYCVLTKQMFHGLINYHHSTRQGL